MPHETSRLIDHDPRRGSRCVAVIGAGERRARFVERFVERHPDFGAMPVVLHLIDPTPSPIEAADDAAGRLASGSRIMVHPTSLAAVDDQPNGTQRLALADDSDMTVDVVVFTDDDATAAPERTRRPDGGAHPRRFSIAGDAAGAPSREDEVARAVLEVLRTRNDTAVCLADIGPDVSVFDGVVLV